MAGDDKKRAKREIAKRLAIVRAQKKRESKKYKYDNQALNRQDKARMLDKRTYDFDEFKERDLSHSPDRYGAPWRRT